MPTNLPPDYFDAEKRYREAESSAEKILCLEEMYSKVPKHKGTDHLRADLRRQISRLKEEAQSHKKLGSRHSEFNISKEGAGQVILTGMPNVGKSSLLAALTRVEPEISEAPFTTWKPAPGMMPYQDIQIQLVDSPPLDPNITDPQQYDLTRRVDVLAVVVDIQEDPIQQLEESLELLLEHRIAPEEYRDRYAGRDRMTFLPAVVLVNKCDSDREDEDCEAFQVLCGHELDILPISARQRRHFFKLGEVLYKKLGIIRVYAQPPGQDPDIERPFVLKQGSTVLDMAAKVHRDFTNNLKSARVWGSASFPGQMVPREYQLHDGDIVELRV